LLKIFKIKYDYYEKYSNKYKSAKASNVFNLIQNKELFIKILGDRINLNNFNPMNLKDFC
jgi:hypothetical protein